MNKQIAEQITEAKYRAAVLDEQIYEASIKLGSLVELISEYGGDAEDADATDAITAARDALDKIEKLVVDKRSAERTAEALAN